MTNNVIKVGTFFSGIGAPEKALERLKTEGVINDYKVEFFQKLIKITPKESWKLMEFDDLDFEKARKLCSETSLYHQAGNSIVVNVIYHILKELLMYS